MASLKPEHRKNPIHFFLKPTLRSKSFFILQFTWLLARVRVQMEAGPLACSFSPQPPSLTRGSLEHRCVDNPPGSHSPIPGISLAKGCKRGHRQPWEDGPGDGDGVGPGSGYSQVSRTRSRRSLALQTYLAVRAVAPGRPEWGPLKFRVQLRLSGSEDSTTWPPDWPVWPFLRSPGPLTSL